MGTLSGLGYATSDDIHAASLATSRQILDVAWEGGVRAVLVTGGGEVLIWEHLLEALAYAAGIGFQTCMYTNGLRLGVDRSLARHLLMPENGLRFIRLSINAVSKPVVKKHWGLDVIDVDQQLRGLSALLQARDALAAAFDRRGQPVPSIQISTIVDRQNVGDLGLICRAVADAFGAPRLVSGEEDVMVVRPLTVHGRAGGYSSHDHDERAVIRRVIAECGSGGDAFGLLAGVGVRLFLGFGLADVASGVAESYSSVIEREYSSRDISYANGVFLTVGPDGTVYPLTEHNCDRDWALGSLLSQSVREIYSGQRRRSVIAFMNNERWGASVSQATSRTARLDRIARAMLRGHLTDQMIDTIAEKAARSHHVLLD